MSSPVMWYTTRATGVVALVLLSAVMVLGVLTASRRATARWPGVALQDLHRRLSLLSVVFVAGHVLTSVLDSFVHIGWAAAVVPGMSDYKRLGVALGAVSLDFMLAVLVTSLLRARIAAPVWRGIHWLVYVSWPVAVLHTLATGTDVRFRWVLWVVGACVFGVVFTAGVSGGERLARRRRVAALPAVRRRAPGVGVKHVAER